MEKTNNTAGEKYNEAKAPQKPFKLSEETAQGLGVLRAYKFATETFLKELTTEFGDEYGTSLYRHYEPDILEYQNKLEEEILFSINDHLDTLQDIKDRVI